MSEAPEQEAFEGWAILELMGHRRLAGFVAEVQIAGASFLRIDIPSKIVGEEKPRATQFYSASAIYCITPTTEATAYAVASMGMPEPVSRWELPHSLDGMDDDLADVVHEP